MCKKKAVVQNSKAQISKNKKTASISEVKLYIAKFKTSTKLNSIRRNSKTFNKNFNNNINNNYNNNNNNQPLFCITRFQLSAKHIASWPLFWCCCSVFSIKQQQKSGQEQCAQRRWSTDEGSTRAIHRATPQPAHGIHPSSCIILSFFLQIIK